MLNQNFSEFVRKEFNKNITLEKLGGGLGNILHKTFSGSCIPPTKDSNGSALLIYELGLRGIVLVHTLLEFNPNKTYDYTDHYVRNVHIHLGGIINSNLFNNDSLKNELNSYLDQYI